MAAKKKPNPHAVALQAMRKHRGGGGGKPRTVLHDPNASRCLCVDCRKARGQYSYHLKPS